ncbi:MAG: PP2C family protein-serine/threonine phosphatase, partial [Chitinophagales bacterium]|nr:PP2C family protein-serine/threonine phosphatase [Chitinophagales bacterium]
EYLFCISDVSGKGISAALIMANLQANLRILAEQKLSLNELVQKLNHNVCNITKGEKYFTFFVGIINTQLRRLTYINAGHTPSLLWNNGKVYHLDKGCTILGMFKKLPSVEVTEIELSEKALILNYTDGLSEASDNAGNLFELERIEHFLQENHNLPVRDFNRQLIQEMENFKKGTEYDDDLSLLTIRIR